MQDSPDAKKPCKGILKTSSSFDKPNARNLPGPTTRALRDNRKSAKFDELNVLQTYHPIDKDYGHMKIEEPKTPYNYLNPDEESTQLDANLLAEKLRIAANTQTPAFGADDLSDDEFAETEEEKVRRLEFERRRKAHYNEFEAVKLARKLIKEELGDESEEDLIADVSEMPSEYGSEGARHGRGIRGEHDPDLDVGDVDGVEEGGEEDDDETTKKSVKIVSDVQVKVMDVDQNACAADDD